MLNAKLYFKSLDSDLEMQRTAWQTSLLMTASGNYGKRGVDMKKLYKPNYDEMGNPIIHNDDSTFTSIDKEEKDNKLNELIKKFNKE